MDEEEGGEEDEPGGHHAEPGTLVAKFGGQPGKHLNVHMSCERGLGWMHKVCKQNAGGLLTC